MSHPLLGSWWGDRGDPTDERRCRQCGGYLSFELHDLWHEIALWNAMIFDAAEDRRQEEFEATLRARGQHPDKSDTPGDAVLDI